MAVSVAWVLGYSTSARLHARTLLYCCTLRFEIAPVRLPTYRVHFSRYRTVSCGLFHCIDRDQPWKRKCNTCNRPSILTDHSLIHSLSHQLTRSLTRSIKSISQSISQNSTYTITLRQRHLQHAVMKGRLQVVGQNGANSTVPDEIGKKNQKKSLHSHSTAQRSQPPP